MTMYATTSHQGGQFAGSRDMGCCGQVHTYVDGSAGYPEITCGGGCEDWLRAHDTQHAAVPSKVPMTYDEKLVKDDLEQRSNVLQSTVQAIASARLAGMHDHATQLATMAGIRLGETRVCPAGHPNGPDMRFCGQCGQGIGVPGGVRCAQGHENNAGARFCVDCGAKIELPAPPQPPSAPAAATAPAETVPVWPSNTKMRAMKRDVLAALATEHGLDGEGTREELLTRLIDTANEDRPT